MGFKVVNKVSNYNQEENYPQIKKDVEDVKQSAQEVESKCDELQEALGVFTPVRRIDSAAQEAKEGDYAGAIGLATLAAINLPADCSDIKEATKQLRAVFKGEEYVRAYDYSKYQHPFSFFRGTLLHNVADPTKSKYPEFAEKLINADKTVANTQIGKKILNALNIECTDFIETKIKDIGHTEEIPRFVNAKVYDNTASFGKLTARAMERTTLIGTAVVAALELPKVIKAFTEGDNATEKVENGAKQGAKSTINLAASTIGIAYGGAIGSKIGGPAGSLVGMGLGAFLSSKLSNKIQEALS